MTCAAQILIFTRFPIPGQAKTRLIPALGRENAARLHRRMTEHALSVARAVHKTGSEADVGITVCCTGSRLRDFRAWLGVDLQYASQPAGDLGIRLRWAFKSAFDAGAKCAVAVGTDVPDLSTKILQQALDSLRRSDTVLGPAEDGGYYLIGMRRFHPELFADMSWGTECVCARTRDAIKRLGLNASELPRLNDVDHPEDLSSLRSDPRFADVFSGKAMLTIIIPALNEAATLSRTLERVQGADAIETIVVDGGSHDTTREIAARAGAVVIGAPGGRARQQNAGATAAKGHLLLFLHADTLPPVGYADQIRAALDNPTTVAGAFRFRTDGTRAAIRMLEWTTNFRSTVLHWPYGDQGLFMQKRVFAEMGGFASLPIMEDFELVRRLRRRGAVVTLAKTVMTSARRWEQLGIIRTTIINQIMIAGFLSGVPVHTLDRLYRINGTKRRKGKQKRNAE